MKPRAERPDCHVNDSSASLRAVKSKCPRVESVGEPSLFPMAKPENENALANRLEVDRPYVLHPDIRIGTSAFTADGWGGSFYPAGLKDADL